MGNRLHILALFMIFVSIVVLVLKFILKVDYPSKRLIPTSSSSLKTKYSHNECYARSSNGPCSRELNICIGIYGEKTYWIRPDSWEVNQTSSFVFFEGRGSLYYKLVR